MPMTPAPFPALVAPKQSFETLAAWATANLSQAIAIESQSRDESPTIPSTPGQREVSAWLRAVFTDLDPDVECTEDACANLLVHLPRNTSDMAPKLALMVHLDTAEGTEAVPRLEVTRAWDGTEVRYPSNARLHVSAERYPATREFVGDDVLHGPGRAPVGFDDKVGLAEVVTLAQVLATNPDIPHGDVFLVFRPDEEIGRMAAVEGLADSLSALGVNYGYTIDGLAPFEIETENFNASRARITFRRHTATVPGVALRADVRIHGVKTHGATAKDEGHLNALTVLARAWPATAPSETSGLRLVAAASDPNAEVHATASLVGYGPTAEHAGAQLTAGLEALAAVLAPHAWRGAALELVGEQTPVDTRQDLDVTPELVVRHVQRFLMSEGERPKLPEDSGGYQGYSNPHFVRQSDEETTLDYRIRDFSEPALHAREAEIRRLAKHDPERPAVEVRQQYVNMGPALAPFPELVTWATRALEPLGVQPKHIPMRGGTGVDPFLTRGIPVANLGTGYFAPESEKELTSRQSLARHVLWLTYLVQVVAHRRD